MISGEDYANLPDGPIEAFLKLEALCRQRMGNLITDETYHRHDVHVQREYMTIVSAVALEFGINLPFRNSITGAHVANHGFVTFMIALEGEIAKMRASREDLSKDSGVK